MNRSEAIKHLWAQSDYVRDYYCASAAEREQHERETEAALLALGVQPNEGVR